MIAFFRASIAWALFLCLAALAFAQAPTITGFSPSTIGIGMPVVITGTNFVTPVNVRFAGVNATGAVVNSSTQITVPAPSTLNPGTITVTTAAGTATSPTSYTVTLVPIITGFSPDTGPEKRLITISGFNFLGTPITSRTVRVNGTLATNLSVSSTAITFPIPAGATSGPITVETNQGFAATATNLTVAVGPPPPNDNFASATIISGPNGFVTGNNANASSEPGEPIHPGSSGGGRSVWFKWIAPSSGLFLFNPYDGQQFGIVQAIYTGGDVAALTLVANGLPPTSVFARYSSAAVLNAVAGTTYMIALDGYTGVMANYRLSWQPLGPPTVTTFTPSATYSGQQVSISGTNFTPGATVTIAGAVVNPARINWNSQTSIIVNQLPYASTTGKIVVTTPAGTAMSSGNFVALTAPAPSITGFSPATGAPGITVTITGTNLWVGVDAPAPVVRFNGLLASSVSASNATSITAVVPPGATTGPITVSFPHGTGTSSASFGVTGAVPTISGFSPASGPVGTAVTITGAEFGAVDQVRFNGVPAAFAIDSPTQITTSVPPGATTGEITVGSPAGTAFSGTSFVVTSLAPIITDFAPTAIAPGMTVVINGSHFGGATGVSFATSNATFTVVSPNQITATAPGTLIPGAITVTTPFGTATSPTNYTISLAPVITGISPTSGPVNRIVTVTGSNFFSPVTVLVNGTSIGSFSRGNTTLTFAIPAGATTGPVTVQTTHGLAVSPMNLVIGPGPAPANDHFAAATPLLGASGVFPGNTANATKEPGEPNHAGNPGGASVWFTWTAPSSGLFLFNPHNSSSSQFGIIQTIYTGNSLTSLTPVASGLTPTNVFARYGSAAVLNAVAGTTYRIALDGYNGVMADYQLAWSPLSPPTISGFSPSAGTAGQTMNVNLNGSNFTPGSVVVFGGATVDPSRLNFQNPNLITISQIPIHAVTGPISITTPAGSATSAGLFSVTPPPPPTITGFSPSGAAAGFGVTITGTNFTGATAVTFNGTSASFGVVAANTIGATIPVGASTGPIQVTTPGGTATSPAPFVVIVPPIIIDDPDSQSVFVGANVTMSVTATSNGPEEYQWLKDGAPILGNATANTPTLNVPSAGFGDAGSYVCKVFNQAGHATSAPAILTVNPRSALVALSNLTATFDGTPKAVTATVTPPVAVSITYDGSPLPPSAAGSYHVVATVIDPFYVGSATGTLTINPAPVIVTLTGLVHVYDGTTKRATVATDPIGHAVALTYNGSATPPTLPGEYAVLATVLDPNYVGSATGTLSIGTTAVVRRIGTMNGGIDGSVQLVTGADVALSGNAWVSGDLLVPGTPNVVLRGGPTYGGTLDGTGSASPAGYSIVLNGGSVLRHVVRRLDPVALPVIAAPPAPAGTRNVMLTSASQSPGDFATVRNLTVTGSAGLVTVPPGTYGELTANGSAGFVLGIAGATTPAVYNLQRLTLNASARLQVVGPVLLTVAGNVSVNGTAGEAAQPDWLALAVAAGNVTVNGTLTGRVTAPGGTVAITGQLTGSIIANEVTVGGAGLLTDPKP